MKRSRFSKEQSVGVLKEAEAGVPVKELCRQVGVSEATFYHWKVKYGGLEVNETRRLRQLEEENVVAWAHSQGLASRKAKLRHRQSGLNLLQKPDDLLFTITALPHPNPPSSVR